MKTKYPMDRKIKSAIIVKLTQYRAYEKKLQEVDKEVQVILSEARKKAMKNENAIIAEAKDKAEGTPAQIAIKAFKTILMFFFIN